MNINNKKKTFLLIGILVLTMLIVSGGTFAYFRWISSEDQQTNLAIQIEENISMHIENPALEKTGMYPTNTCTNVAATMSGVSIIALENQTGVIARPKFKLRVKITDKDGNVITNNSAGTDNGNNPYRYFINYAVAEENGTCTEPLYSGNFDQNEPTYQGQTQWYDSEWITLMNETTGFPLISNGQDSGVSFNGTPYQTTYHNYKVWVWIDESYVSVNTGDVVSDKLQDAKIELSWSENSTVQQIKAQAYAVFSSSEEGGDDSLRFYQSDEPITEDSTYAGRPVTNVYTGFETETYDSSNVPWDSISSSVKTVVFEDTITPISTAHWFDNFYNCSHADVTKLDTSNVIDMRYMFNSVGSSVESFLVEGLENFDTSNVTSMKKMFWGVGAEAITITIDGIDNWDTSKVRNMRGMFTDVGYGATTFNISDISGWDVSNVTDMEDMFFDTGRFATNNWSLDLSNWNVTKVTNHTDFNDDVESKITPPVWYTSYAVYSNQDSSLRFYRTQTDLTQQSTWNDLEITTVYNGGNHADNQGFESLSYSSASDVPWNEYAQNIRRVVVENEIYPKSTAYWFSGFNDVEYIDVAKLNTSNVTDMNNMFSYMVPHSNNSSLSIVGMENWDTSNVRDMSGMFIETGMYISSFNISDISKWNTSNVTNMSSMFYDMGASASNWSLDLSNWNVSKVDSFSHDSFNQNVEDKIIPPKWVN